MATPIKKSYKFAALKAEANKGKTKKTPFVIDDVVPKITIRPPRSMEQSIQLTEMVDADGNIAVGRLREAFKVVCGSTFEQVWALIKDEDVEVGTGLLTAVMAHYSEEYNTAEAADAPGGTDAS